MEQGGDEGDLLLHAVGAVGDGLGQVVGHAQEFPILPDAGGAVCLGHAVYVGHKVQVLQAGEKIVQVRIVRYVGKLLLAGQGLFLDGMPGHKNIALGQLENAATGFQRGGFSGAVVADETEDLPWGDVQAQIIHSGFCAIGLRKVFNSEHTRYLSSLEWHYHSTGISSLQGFRTN